MLRYFFILPVLMLFLPLSLRAKDMDLTFIHTNDMHSHLLGYPPTLDYTPVIGGDDDTKGGWARIKTVIDRVKADRSNPVLVVDAGDFMMGSLFHMVCRERAMELRLMKDMGYDMITLGNHEFDLKPAGLSRILRSAVIYGGFPPIVASNLIFDRQDSRDDDLEAVVSEGLVKPYDILVREGVTIGFFGLMGHDAAEVAPFASPVTFADHVAAAKKYTTVLRKKNVDIVVCLSHCGLDPVNISRSEDVRLAREVPGIDIIIGGHTHTMLYTPIIEGRTIIVQAWSNGRWVGILDVVLRNGAVTMKRYRIAEIDDRIPGDPAMNARIDAFKQEAGAMALGPLGLAHDSVVASVGFDMPVAEEETNLGNLISDATRWHVNRFVEMKDDPLSRVAVSIESNGLIRDPVRKGKTGRLTAGDLFASFPLGIGPDDTMGYPLVTTYLYAHEIKKALEILTSIHPLKGEDYYLQVSGLRFTYNPRRIIFDRVTGIWLGAPGEGYVPLDYSSSNRQLYRIAANIYNATFLKIIGDFTFGILTIVPKDRDGKPVEDLADALVDADPGRPGIQEVKQWQGLLAYVRNFPDINGDGIPDIPEQYRGKQGRIVREPCMNPVCLMWGGTWVTWAGVCLFCAVAVLIAVPLAVAHDKIRMRKMKD